MFVYVKYEGGEKEVVPALFVKGFILEEAKSFKPGQTVRCFWSPDPEATPETIFKKQNKILDIEGNKVTIKKGKGQKSTDTDAFSGYYKAEFLLMAETEEELLKQLESKRVKIPSFKAKQRSQSKKKTEATEKKPAKKSAALKRLQADGQGKGIENLMPDLPKRSATACKVYVSSDEDDDDDDDEVGPTKTLKEDAAKWKKKWADEKKRNIALSSKVEVLEDLVKQFKKENLQMELYLHQMKQSSASPLKPFEKSFQTPKRNSPKRKASPEKHLDSPLRKSPRLKKKLDFDEKAKEEPKEEPQEEPEEEPQEEPEEEPQKEPKEDAKSAVVESGGTSVNETSSYKVSSEQQYVNALSGLKKGPESDSLFTKNIALAVFGPELFMVSSVKGERCKSKKDQSAKPPLPKEGMDLVQDLFKRRGKEDGYVINDPEFKSRMKKINYWVGKKISTLTRKPSNS